MLPEHSSHATRISVPLPKPQPGGRIPTSGPRPPLDLEASVHKNAGLWVASCEVGCVTATGITREEALDNLSQSLQVYLAACQRRGTLEEVLAQLMPARSSSAG